MSTTSTRDRALRRPPPAALPVLLVLGVLLLAFNMRTAVAEIPPVLPDLGLARGAQSVLATVPVVCFGLAALASPALRSRLGEERGLLLGLVLLLAGVVLRAAWPGAPGVLFSATLLAGCAVAVMNVLVPSLVRRRFAGRVGLMMGVYTTGITLGGTAAAAATVPVRDGTGSLPLALGVWAVPMALGIAVWLPQRRHRALPSIAGGAEAFRALRRSPLAWQVTLFMGLMSLCYYAPLSWLPAIERDRGIDAQTAGLLLSVMNLVALPTNLLAPVFAHRMRDQRAVAGIGCALVIVGVAGILLAPASTALIWVIVLGVGQGATLPVALLIIVMRAGDDETAARLSTMAQGVGYLLAAAGPLVMGLLHAWTGGWSVPLVFLLGISVAQIWAAMLAGRARTVHAAA
ncbi:MAG: transporter, family, cyanate transporter [Solirubrobacteraceae bacterium]|nr:transporter, family, cyanate transporter [Solirubrobacteraceae bacterium]